MKIFTRVLFVTMILAMAGLVNAQTLQTSDSKDANLYGRSGLTSDVDKTNLSQVNIYSYNNAIFVNTSESNLSNAKYAVFTVNGQMIAMNKISSNITRYDMESSRKGLFIVKALVNGKIYTKKVYIY